MCAFFGRCGKGQTSSTKAKCSCFSFSFFCPKNWLTVQMNAINLSVIWTDQVNIYGGSISFCSVSISRVDCFYFRFWIWWWWREKSGRFGFCLLVHSLKWILLKFCQVENDVCMHANDKKSWTQQNDLLQFLFTIYRSILMKFFVWIMHEFFILSFFFVFFISIKNFN